MRFLVLGLFGLAAIAVVFTAPAQDRREQKEEEFLKAKPRVGDPLPDLTVYAADGKEVKTADLRGHYTVLTFGCLT